ncbi:MAG: flavodoxin family protein [Deltaproteobacteria bacterium]|jgi:multimeric flavodoxin WrbA|nr:flavodoxin family protein [Deltaproteobacteria bacterium]
MDVVAIFGSPRDPANSTLLAEEVIKAVKSKEGGEVKRFVLNNLKIRGCQGCNSCKGKTDYCVVKDDLSAVLSASAAADLIVLATPVYMGDVTAQTKIFLDRTFSWLKPDFHDLEVAGRVGPGRKAFLVFTQGNPDASAYRDRFEAYVQFFRWLGFKAEGSLATDLNDPAAALKRPELLAEFKDAALRLVEAK